MGAHPNERPSCPGEPGAEWAVCSTREFVECLEDGFLAVDAGLKVLVANSVAEQLLGLQRAQLVGRELGSLSGTQALSGELLEACRTTLSQRTPLSRVESRASGQQWLEFRLQPRSGQLWLFLRDVTEQHRTQERLKEFEQQQSVLRYVIANVPHAIFWKDREGRLLGGNQNFMRDVGVDRLENLVGKTDYDLACTTEEADFFSRIDREVMNNGTPILNIEEPIQHADGSTHTLLTSKVPLRDEQGQVIGMLGIYADITERKRIEVELQKAKEQAEAAARSRGEFLTVMSHELRTPLTLILGPLGVLLSSRADELSGQARVDLERIQRNAERLFRLVDDILDYQKVEAGRMDVDWEPTPITPFTAQLVEDAGPAADFRQIHLRFEADPVLDTLLLDRRKFEKIVLNLLGNALKFTPEGGSITVALRALGSQVELSVKDSGPGIPREKQALLFQRFQQIDGSATRKHEGTGMGLAIVKAFAELMEGQVSVESEAGAGARFIVRLPRNTAAESSLEGRSRARPALGYFAQLRATPAPVARALRRPAGPAPRLLLAEDNADMRAYLADLLAEDYELELTETGRQAWEAVLRQKPDVIVSDVMMPEMNGIELVSRLKASAEYRDIPILLLTAKASREEAVNGLDAGADDYLGKPFGPSELKSRVRAAARLHQVYQQLEAQKHELETALRRLQETQEQLVIKEKMAAVGTLIAGLCHELNNPMAAIRMNVRMLTHYQLSPEARRASLEVIDQHSRRCASLLRALSLFSSRPALVRTLCSVGAVMGRVIEGAQPELTRRHIRLEQRGASAEPPWIHVHAAEMEQAVLHVVKNALEASPPGSMVTIEAQPLTRGDTPGVEVTVTDHGHGIPDELLPRLIEPFFTTKPPGEGMGLGLSLTHRFLESHGGILDIRSELGHGTTVRMWLPAAPAGLASREPATEVGAS